MRKLYFSLVQSLLIVALFSYTAFGQRSKNESRSPEAKAAKEARRLTSSTPTTSEIPSFTVTVTSGANSGAGTLRTAITQINSNGGGTIVLNVATVTLTTRLPAINAAVMIKGRSELCVATGVGGTRIQRSAAASTPNFGLFEVSDDAVFQDVILSNGKETSENGGAIYSNGFDFSMYRCIVERCSADDGGGVSCAFADEVIIANCVFRNNTAARDGGGLRTFGVEDGVNIENCTFANNQARNGGGAYFESSTDVGVGNCTFSGNSAENGGAIVFEKGDFQDIILNSTFNQNTATATENAGQVIEVYDDSVDPFEYTVYVIGCLFTNNGTNTDTDFYEDGDYLSPILEFLVGGNVTTSTNTDEDFLFFLNGRRGVTLSLPPLANNGGCVLTHAITCNSPAANMLSLGFGSTRVTAGIGYETFFLDQRGSYRDQYSDAGAYEASGFTFTRQPSSVNPCPGSTATFSVALSAEGTLSYQWYKNEEPIANGGRIAGATSATLSISNVQATDNGIYRCKITNACGFVQNSVFSQEAELTIGTSPTVTATVNSPVRVGLIINLNTTAAGQGYRYTWRGPDGWTSNLKAPSRGNATTAMGGVYSLTVSIPGSCNATTTVSTQIIPRNARLATGEEQEDSIELQAAPNPTTGRMEVVVRSFEPTPLKLQLIDVMGRMAQEWTNGEETTEHRLQIDISDKSGGVYMLRAETKDGSRTRKIVKADK